LASQDFFMGDFKHKVLTFETLDVASNLPFQLSCFNSLHIGKLEVEHHALTSNLVYLTLYFVYLVHRVQSFSPTKVIKYLAFTNSYHRFNTFFMVLFCTP